jgi:hypothetical protein
MTDWNKNEPTQTQTDQAALAHQDFEELRRAATRQRLQGLRPTWSTLYRRRPALAPEAGRSTQSGPGGGSKSSEEQNGKPAPHKGFAKRVEWLLPRARAAA